MESLTRQYSKVTGEQMKVIASELLKLQEGAVPSNLASALKETNPALFPNICSLLSALAVLPITNCKAERCIFSLHWLRPYLASTMGPERLTGLALLHIHKEIPVDIEEIVQELP